jgi:uncharacterized protein (TIGR02421 family)
MSQGPIQDFSSRLKEIAKDLSFLGHPRYPLQKLHRFFPQHHHFINELEDVTVPFAVNIKTKRLAMDQFLKDLSHADIPKVMKEIFTHRIEDYHTLLSMMENFDNVFFYDHCTKLYGTSHESTQNNSFLYFLEKIPDFCVPDVSSKKLKGQGAMDYLRTRLLETFSDTDVEVKPSSSLLSDSSAGRRVLKLNPHKEYTTQALDIFLVHEGWVHLGTSLNGASQNEHPWLSTWSPRSTFLQEGLAILTELITGCMTHERWNKVMLRHLATSMAERGSNIQDVYGFLRHHEMEDLDAFKLALRVFRGVPLEGGMAFTKELLYLHGLVQLLYHLKFYQTDLRSIWVGKLSFAEHVILMDNSKEMKPQLRYFPQELDDPQVQMRLKKLQDLAFSLFKQGFIE